MEIHEVFTDLGRKNDGESRAKVLLDNDSLALRTLMRLNYDKTIKLNLSDEIEYKPDQPDEAHTTLANIDKAKELGWQPEISFDEGVKLTVQSLS